MINKLALYLKSIIKKVRGCIVLLSCVLSVCISGQTYAKDVTVTVYKLKEKNTAPVRFSICNSEKEHEKKEKGYRNIDNDNVQLIESTGDYKKYRITNIALGEHSLSAHHDLNDNGKLERQMITGIPQEPIGFSGLDVRVIRRHPKWEDIKFIVDEFETPVAIHLVDRFGF